LCVDVTSGVEALTVVGCRGVIHALHEPQQLVQLRVRVRLDAIAGVYRVGTFHNVILQSTHQLRPVWSM
jgi:hypothetical protein